MTKKKSKVVGLDLSITATGIAGSDGETTTVGGKSDMGDLRLLEILKALSGHMDGDLYIVEDLPTNAHGAGITGMVHGAVRARLLENNKKYVLVTPASLKKYATGKGNANKTDMAIALYKYFQLELKDDNQVDAFFLRCMGLDHLGYPLNNLPKANRDAMDKVNW